MLEISHCRWPGPSPPLSRSRDGFPLAGMVDQYRAAFLGWAPRGSTFEPLSYPHVRETLAALAARLGVLPGMATGKSRREVI